MLVNLHTRRFIPIELQEVKLSHVKIAVAAAVAEPGGPRAEAHSAQRAAASRTPLPAAATRTVERAQCAVQATLRLRV